MSTNESVPTALARLNAVIDDVAQRPGWSYKRVASEAGIDVMTLHALRQGRSLNPTDRTAWGLDRVLGFEQGKGVQRILAGKEPVYAKAAEPQDVTDKAIQEIREKPGLEDWERDSLIDMLIQARDRVLDQANEMSRKRRGSA